MLNSLKSLIVDPYWFIGCYLKEKHPTWMSDKYYLSIQFRQYMGYKLNWNKPRTFNEKLAWLKIYDRNPLYTKLVDKYEVKKWVSEKIGYKYIIPTLGVWDKFEDINFDELPNEFVLKCTHDSGSVVICKDKSSFDFKSAKEKLNNALRTNFYWWAREWPYKNVKPRIIAEKFIIDNTGETNDIKYFCNNGVIKFLKVDFDRFLNHSANYYDVNWNKIDCSENYCPSVADKDFSKPYNVDQLKEIVETLSKNLPFVRIDFYDIDGIIYFGEFTFYPAGGYNSFTPKEWDSKFGNEIVLPINWGGAKI